MSARWYFLCAIILILGSRSSGGDSPSHPKSATSFGSSPGSVNVWLSTADLSTHLAPQAGVTFGPDVATAPYTIDVDENQLYQVIEGFGASLTDSSAWLIYNAAQRDAIMQQLFDPNLGIALSYVRQPIGASDFCLARYSFDDMPPAQTDPGLAAFSINHDRAYILPLLQQALSLNPVLKVMGTPWSPPGWMKTSGSMMGGSLNRGAYGPYAQYLVKFIQAYAAEGVPVDAITVQNEPLFVPDDYPGMYMPAADQATFITNYLGPAFASAGISTKILAYDHNWDPSYPIDVLNDPAAKAYIAGSAFHCYDGDVSAQSTVEAAHPDRDIYFTECSGRTWETVAVAFRYDIEKLIIGSIRNWAKTVQKWNLALDQHNGPHTGGCSTCLGLVTIDTSSGQVTYNAGYYALAHASKFVVPGARRIASTTNGPGSVESVAFKNADGTKVLVVLNAGVPTSFKVHSAARSFLYTLGAGDVATFTWSDTGTDDGTTLLDRSGWVATASSSSWSDDPANAFDGNASTRWSTGTSQSNGQWFQVDMGQVQTISSLTIDTGASMGDYPRAYQVLLSTDGSTFSQVASGTGSQFFTVPFARQSARYIKIVQTGSAGNWWSLHELHVFGMPIRTASALDRTGWVATASSTASGDVPANGLDATGSTRWSTGVPESNGQWFQVDMRQVNTIDSITIDAGGSTGDYPRGYQVLLSTNGSTFTQVANGSGSGQLVTVTVIPQSARYIKIVQTGSAANWWSIHELNVRGTGVGSPSALNRAGWIATASSTSTDPCCTGDLPASALDGSQSTRWSTGVPESNGQWFQVDMGQINTIERITIDAGTSSADFPRGYQVLLSTNGSTFSQVASGTGSTSFITVNFAAQPARYIKIVQTGSSIYWWSIHELNAYP
jgi:glucosylceramidase